MTTQKRNLIIVFAIAALVILLTAGSGFALYEVYYQVNDSAPVRAFAAAFGLPAAKVGNRSVSYNQFLLTRDAVKRFINSEAGKDVQATMPPEDVLNNSIMDRLVRQDIVQELADQNKIAVTDEEIDSVFSDVIKAAASSTTPDVKQYLMDNYGWNENDFKKQVLKPALLEQNLSNAMAQAKSGDQSAMENAINARYEQPDVVVLLKF